MRRATIPKPRGLRVSALRPLIVLEYVIVALLAWLAGLVWIGTTGSMQMSITQGTMVFDVILVVVLGGISLIGGRGSVFSVVVGCALIGTLLNAFTIMDVNSEVQNIIRGFVSACGHPARQLAASARRGDGASGRLTDHPALAGNTSKIICFKRGGDEIMLNRQFLAGAAMALAGAAILAVPLCCRRAGRGWHQDGP